VGSVHPGTSRSAGVPSRAWPRGGEQARDLRRSPGPRGGHAATETDRRQPRQPTSEAPETNGSNLSGNNQLVLESIDTVGVTGSILRSPTLNPPDSGGFSHFQTTVGPRWGHATVGWRWIGRVRAWHSMGRQNFSGSLDGAGARRRAIPGDWRRWLGAAGVDHGEQRRVVAADWTAGARSGTRALTGRVMARRTRVQRRPRATSTGPRWPVRIRSSRRQEADHRDGSSPNADLGITPITAWCRARGWVVAWSLCMAVGVLE
jgi:hypothetical protein